MGSRGAPLERRSTTAGFASHASVPKPCPWPIFVPSIRINTFKIPYYRHTTDKKAVNSFLRSKKGNFAFSAPIRISIRMNSRIRLADPPSRPRACSRSAATPPPSSAHITSAPRAVRVTPRGCHAAHTSKMGASRAPIRAWGASWPGSWQGCPPGSDWSEIGRGSKGGGAPRVKKRLDTGSRAPLCSGGPAAGLWRRSDDG